MLDIFAPDDLFSEGVLNDHQSEAPAPVGRGHLDDDMLVSGYLLDIPHTLQVAGDCPHGYAAFQGKLCTGLLPLNIVRDYFCLIAASSAIKTASTVFAFIPLDMPS